MLYNGIHSICKGKNDVLQSVILLRPDLTDVNKRDLVQQLRNINKRVLVQQLKNIKNANSKVVHTEESKILTRPKS